MSSDVAREDRDSVSPSSYDGGDDTLSVSSIELPTLRVSSSTPEKRRSSCLDEPFAVWRDLADSPIGRAGLEGQTCWIELDGIGVYRFSLADGDVQASPVDGVNHEIVVDTYRRSVLPHVLQVRGIQVLHASGVLGVEGVVGLCGVSGVGKSTLALGLADRQWEPWADDALAVGFRAASAVTYSLPFRFRQEDGAVEIWLPALETGHRPIGSSTQLQALVVLRRIEGSETRERFRWHRFEPSRAFEHLLPHAYWLDLGDTVRRRQMMETYLKMAAEVPVFDCAFVPDRRNLPDLMDKLEDALGDI